MKKRSFLYIISIISVLPAFSQSTESHATILEARKQGATFSHTDAYVAHVLTGKKYWNTRRHYKQFFLEKSPIEGNLIYDGVLFNNIEMQYNLFTQQVIVLLETKNNERYVTISLDKISGFSIYSHEFTLLSGDSVMKKGIYELAYTGTTSNLFIKRTKRLKEVNAGMDLKIDYTPVNRYYLRNEFGTNQITSKKDLLNAYDNSEELNSIIKENRIKFSKKKIEQGLISALSYLDPNPNK